MTNTPERAIAVSKHYAKIGIDFVVKDFKVLFTKEAWVNGDNGSAARACFWLGLALIIWFI